VGRDREARPSRRPSGGSVDPFLLGRQPWLVGTDLADDPGPDPRAGDAFGCVADDLVGEIVDRPAID
jgi:hypothetical protein